MKFQPIIIHEELMLSMYHLRNKFEKVLGLARIIHTPLLMNLLIKLNVSLVRIN